MMTLMSPYTLCLDQPTSSGSLVSESSDWVGLTSSSLFACGLLSLVAATSTGAMPAKAVNPHNLPAITSSGTILEGFDKSHESPIGELRRISGLTWDQLARIFDVSVRSLHLWVSGGPLSAGNEEKLSRVLIAMRRVDRGIALQNRSLILGATKEGVIPLDLLIAGAFDRFVDSAGISTSVRLSPPIKADLQRIPIPLADLMDSKQEVVHHEIGGGRAAKTLRGRGSGKS